MFLIYLIPNSEIKMAGMRQAVGAETVWKNRRHTRRGLVRLPLREAHNLNGQLNGRGWGSQFSKPFNPKSLMPTGRFNFGVRVKPLVQPHGGSTVKPRDFG